MRGYRIVMVLAFASGLFAAAAGVSPAPAPASTPTPQWRVQRTPLPSYANFSGRDWGDGNLGAVSCPTTSFCLALGSSVSQFPDVLGGWWNGSQWSTDPAGLSGSPSGISCVSAKKCYAVLNDALYSAADPNSQTAEYAVWNGRSWNEAYDLPPEKRNDELKGISCPSSGFCMAVGQVGRNTLYALAYNGRKWRQVPVPRSRARQLSAVACPAANACFAVGPSPGGGQLGLIERWNGRSWRTQRAPVAVRARHISLNGVSCSTQTACVAVGSYQDRAKNSHVLALGWNGRAWHRLTFANTSGDLASVSCVAGGSCVAVGSMSREPVARVWNDTRWSLQRIPNGAHANLSSVSCATESYCMTVGALPVGLGTPFAASYS